MFWMRPRLMGRTAGGSPLTFTFLASAVSNGASITVPASVLDNDFGILIDVASSTGDNNITAVTPTNWTNRLNDFVAGTEALRAMMSTKVLTTAEASGSITGMNDDHEEKIMLVFRPSRAILTSSFSTINSQGSSSNPSSQTVSAQGQPSPLLVIGAAATPISGTAAFSTASPAFDATVTTGDSDMIAGYKIYNSSPQNHSIDMNDLGDHNALLSFFVRFT